MELKLNVSSKGRIWSHIGDILFEFGSNKKNAATSILLTADQYAFVEVLMTRVTRESCRDV